MNSSFLPLGSLMQNNHKSVVLVTLLTSIISTSDESPFFFIFLPSLICFLCRLIIRLFFPSLPFLFQCTNAVAVVICKNSATTSGLVWSQMAKIMISQCFNYNLMLLLSGELEPMAEKICVTDSGATPNKPCIFPFKFNGVLDFYLIFLSLYITKRCSTTSAPGPRPT